MVMVVVVAIYTFSFNVACKFGKLNRLITDCKNIIMCIRQYSKESNLNLKIKKMT